MNEDGENKVREGRWIGMKRKERVKEETRRRVEDVGIKEVS